MRWPWTRQPASMVDAPSPTAAPAVDVEAVAVRAAEAAAAVAAERAAQETAELFRGLVSGSPLGALGPQTAAAQFPIYAFDRPFTYQTPQAPSRHPGSLVTVDTLRMLADTYDVLRACIQHLKREVLSVPIQIVPRDDSDTSDTTTKRQQEALAWFETDGGLGGVGVERTTFEGMWLEDLLVVGADAIFLRGTKGGGLYEALAIDAATIRPRVDAFGWPGPGEKAYEQWIYGVMVADFTRDELRYMGLSTNARTHTPYFASPIEYLIYTVNTALRSDLWNRTWLTDGNTPSDLISLPETWTPNQIKEFAAWWDTLLAGDTTGRQKTRFVPGGSSRIGNPTRKDADFATFDLWLLRRTCSIMGVQPASIGFVGEQYKVTQGESMTATTQFGAGPLLDHRKALYDYLLRRRGYGDLECKNVTQQEEDAKSRAERNEIRIRSGQCTPNEARAEDGLDPIEGGDTLFLVNTLVPVEHAANPPEPVQPEPGAELDKKPATDDEPSDTATERALRQWERKALNRLKVGKSADCDFQHDAIAPPLHQAIRSYLAGCETADQVRGGFTLIVRGWNEQDHPRDEKGRFTSTGGGVDAGAGAGGAGAGAGGDEAGRIPTEQAAQRITELHNHHGGCTFNLYDGDLAGKPLWAVSPYPERSLIIPGAEVKPAQLQAFVKKHSDLLSERKHSVGTWYNADDGSTYIDVSVTLSDRKEVEQIARDADQIGIYGLEKGEYVHIGGTGKGT